MTEKESFDDVLQCRRLIWPKLHSLVVWLALFSGVASSVQLCGEQCSVVWPAVFSGVGSSVQWCGETYSVARWAVFSRVVCSALLWQAVFVCVQCRLVMCVTTFYDRHINSKLMISWSSTDTYFYKKCGGDLNPRPYLWTFTTSAQPLCWRTSE